MNYFWRRMKKLLAWGLTAACLLFLLLFPSDVSDAIKESLALCYNVIIPSLFPFFVLSAVIVGSGLADVLGRLFRPLMEPIFRVPGNCACAFFLGLLSGYPVGAQSAVSLYKEGLVNKTEAERLLAFCNNSGPAFVLGAVGTGMFFSPQLGLLLYICHALSSLTVGILFRFYRKDTPLSSARKSTRRLQLPLSTVFVDGVKSAVSSILTICGFVVFFSILIHLGNALGIFPAVGRLFQKLFFFTGQDTAFFQNFFAGFLEVTSGVSGIAASGASLSTRLWQAAAVMGWAGLSVHCQVFFFLSGSGISARPYLIGKLLHGALAGLYTFLALSLFPLSAESVFLSLPSPIAYTLPSFLQTLLPTLSGALFLLIFFLFLLLLRSPAKKCGKEDRKGV